ncbi:MAG: ATP-binding protein, partial [Endomicrobiia bacterium]
IQKAVSLRKPLLIQNGIIHYPELKKLDIKPQPKIISSMVLPIVSNKNVIGVLNIARLSPKKEKFNEFDFNLAQYWCSWLVLAYSIILGFKLSVEYDKMKCDFVSVINHELRTPLMAILGSIELVANRIPQNIYDIIIRNINRLRSLIEELLDFSKISKGIFKIEKKENNISEIINEIFEEYKPLCDSNNVKLIVEKNIKADICFVDKERIKQVLINLISNSLKWYPEDRQEKYIKISVEEKDDYYLFSVEDNAQGMKKEDLDKLFQPFIQLGDVMTQHKPGLGIGLVINKSIIEEHKGKIWVESEYGKGTKVNFIIPKK